jgi:hypothetical protein
MPNRLDGWSVPLPLAFIQIYYLPGPVLCSEERSWSRRWFATFTMSPSGMGGTHGQLLHESKTTINLSQEWSSILFNLWVTCMKFNQLPPLSFIRKNCWNMACLKSSIWEAETGGSWVFSQVWAIEDGSKILSQNNSKRIKEKNMSDIHYILFCS